MIQPNNSRPSPAQKTPTPATPESVRSREETVRLFDSVAGSTYDDNQVAWNAVMDHLALALCYQPHVSVALQSGAWKQKRDPRAWIATIAARQTATSNLADRRGREATFHRGSLEAEPLSQLITGRQLSDEAPLSYEDRVDGASARVNISDYIEDDDLADRVPDWLRDDPDSDTDIDWERIAEYAAPRRMEDSVADVLRGRAEGQSRESMLAGIADESRRKELQAAWQWVTRNWKSRIAPLFEMDRPPKPAPKPARRRGFVPPAEAIREACARSRRLHGQPHIPIRRAA